MVRVLIVMPIEKQKYEFSFRFAYVSPPRNHKALNEV